MNVLHIITGLDDGGAEAALFRLTTNDYNNEHIVISLMSSGKYGRLLLLNGIDVHCLNMTSGKISYNGVVRLYKLLRNIKPDIVQTWMYHADLIGGVVARFAGIRNINWGVHHSNLTPKDSKKSTVYIAKLCACFSWFIPKNIICCAVESAKVHEKLGYQKSKIKVIPNGYDLDLFNIDNQSRATIRKEFSVPEGIVFLGMVSRFHPFKDHQNLINSLGELKIKGYKFFCLLVGKGISPCNQTLNKWIKKNNVVDEVILAGNRNDIPMVMNALDIHLLSSSSEAFPNVLNEAMACGTPCVTTDVGDAALIVGKTGWVVPIKNSSDFSSALSHAIDEMIEQPINWVKRSQSAREHILFNFKLDVMVSKYNGVWCS